MEPTPNSTSASPEPDNALVGVDPNDTDVVSFMGGKFKLGVCQAGIWDDLNAKWVLVYQDSMRRNIRALKEKGIEPETSHENGVLTELDYANMMDPITRRGYGNIYIEALRYSVIEFSNFKNKAGTEFPCVRETVEVNGVQVQRLNDASMKVFQVNRSVAEGLWLLIRRLNQLGAPEKKG